MDMQSLVKVIQAQHASMGIDCHYQQLVLLGVNRQ